jgi:hypothetical protein
MTFLSSLTFKTIFLKMEAWENNMHVLKMSEREYWEVSNEQAINMINEFFTGDCTGIIDTVITFGLLLTKKHLSQLLVFLKIGAENN